MNINVELVPFELREFREESYFSYRAFNNIWITTRKGTSLTYRSRHRPLEWLSKYPKIPIYQHWRDFGMGINCPIDFKISGYNSVHHLNNLQNYVNGDGGWLIKNDPNYKCDYVEDKEPTYIDFVVCDNFYKIKSKAFYENATYTKLITILYQANNIVYLVSLHYAYSLKSLLDCILIGMRCHICDASSIYVGDIREPRCILYPIFGYLSLMEFSKNNHKHYFNAKHLKGKQCGFGPSQVKKNIKQYLETKD